MKTLTIPRPREKLKSGLDVQKKGKKREIITVDRCPWSCLATIFANTSPKKEHFESAPEISLRPGL